MDNSKEFREFLKNLLIIKKGQARLLCGSASELPTQYVIANATDLDVMHIPTDICALPVNASTPQKFQGKRLTVNTKDTHPGFARLYCWPNCKQLYRRNESIVEHHCRQGPAWTKTLFNSRQIHVNFKLINFVSEALRISEYRDLLTRLLKLKLDKVPAIYCPCWPAEAEEWIRRERPSGWPPAKIIDKIVASGCYFVTKPHHSTPDDDTQWRFSFSHAEVILIHSWTCVQKYIYHILRLIKSEVVKACGGPEETNICTYFFKTLMFWDCERKPEEFWKDENVENSISELLCIMIEWLIDGFCPNYFIPTNNMISVLTERADFSKEIQWLLSYAMSNINKFTIMWPRAYSKHAKSLTQVGIQEKFLAHVYLMQLRDNYLNPLNSKIKVHLLKQLTEKNSLFLRKANALYRGILSHLESMKECCSERKCFLKRDALCHFMLSLKESRDEYSERFISIGESIYEFLEGINNVTNSKHESSETVSKIRTDSHKLHFNGNGQQSPLNNLVECGIGTKKQFVCCYTRHEGGEKDGIRSKIINNAAVENLGASVKIVLKILFALVIEYVTSATHVISSAYLANFYYTALHDYKKTSAVCDSLLSFPRGNPGDGKNDVSFAERAFPLFLTNELSSIFDEHFRTVLGLITLYRSIVASPHDTSTVLVRMCPAQFLKYLKIQCRKWEGAVEPEIDESFECRHAFYEGYDTYEPLSQVFMSAVLYASRR